MQGKRRLVLGQRFLRHDANRRLERGLGRRLLCRGLANGSPRPRRFWPATASYWRPPCRGVLSFPAASRWPATRLPSGAECSTPMSAPNGQPNWIELKPADRDDCGGSWQPGDVFIVSVKIVPDAAARAWYVKNDQVQFLFGAGSNVWEAPPVFGPQRAGVPEGFDQHLVMFGACTKARDRAFDCLFQSAHRPQWRGARQGDQVHHAGGSPPPPPFSPPPPPPPPAPPPPPPRPPPR